MGVATIDHVGLMAQADTCRLIVRKEKGLSEIIQFVVPGLEIGQQVVVVGDPTFLNNIARGLSEYGLRPDVFLHSGRLVFLTAPDCLNELLRAGDPLQRSPLHLHGTVMRWVTDWSWALSKGDGLNVIGSTSAACTTLSVPSMPFHSAPCIARKSGGHRFWRFWRTTGELRARFQTFPHFRARHTHESYLTAPRHDPTGTSVPPRSPWDWRSKPYCKHPVWGAPIPQSSLQIEFRSSRPDCPKSRCEPRTQISIRTESGARQSAYSS